jgi:uncharacterized protein involved in type VI secretion and phage assembly
MTDTERKTAISQIFIQVNGADLSVDTMDLLEEVIVEQDLAQPAMFTLRLNDTLLSLIDGTLFKLGAEVQIYATDLKGRRKPLMVGEITALEPCFEQYTRILVVRGYDKSHRLYRGSKARTFLKQTDSQIASTIAQEAGLSADVQATKVTYDYVVQDNQTDMEFLRERAARNGYQIVVDKKTLKFRSAEAKPPDAEPQDLGISLLSFRARLSAVAQPNNVEVRGWDTKDKRAIVGTASSPDVPSKIGEGNTGGQSAQKSFGSSAKLLVTDRPVQTQGEATALAQALLDEMSGDYLSAEGTCLGEPTILAGSLLQIKGVGTKLGGKYFITACRHTFSSAEGYRTTFYVSGRRPTSLLAAFDAARPRHAHVVDGVATALVTNINDPDGLGRVKVKFPWLDEQHESDWVRLATPGAGQERGFFATPEVNDEVLVAFEHGDAHRPYVIGGLWNSKDKPPVKAVEGGKVQIRTFKTRAGHTITLNDQDGAGKKLIEIKTAGGHTVTLADGDKRIQIKSKSHTITLDDQGRAVRLESGGDVEIKGMGGKLTITSQGVELSGSANGKLVLAGQGVELTSNSNLKVQANAMLDVKTSAIMNIQGTLVKIN